LPESRPKPLCGRTEVVEVRRITFPLEGFNVSGGVRVIIQVANGLAERGHRVRIVVPDYAARPPFRLHESVELEIRRTGRPKFLKKFLYLVSLCLTATKKSDICFATGYKTPYYLCLSKCLCLSPAKLVYLIQHYEPLSHAGGRGWLSNLILYRLAKLGYKLPLKKVAVSSWVRDMVGDAKASVIDNGIDLSMFRPTNGVRRTTEAFTVGTIAGAAEWKGYRVFLDAIRQIPDQEKRKMRVLVASQIPTELPNGMSAQLIKPSGESELVAFYNSCDIFICSSFIEGFGLPGLEAMACGVPVITTSCGGVSQYANSSNCFIVAPDDSSEMADSIVKLRRNDNLRVIFRENGLETSRRFSLEKMIEWYLRLLSVL